MPKPPADTWKARVWAEWRVGNLTRNGRDVMLNLATYRGRGGVCFPSHETLAERVKCCVRTVQRALDTARDLGLLDWNHRRVRRGWRCLRSSNSYRLMVPADSVTPIARPIWRQKPTTGLHVGGGETKEKKEALQAMLNEAKIHPDLLFQRRTDFVTRQRAPLHG